MAVHDAASMDGLDIFPHQRLDESLQGYCLPRTVKMSKLFETEQVKTTKTDAHQIPALTPVVSGRDVMFGFNAIRQHPDPRPHRAFLEFA